MAMALVTGATRGIGAATAEALRARGFEVVKAGRGPSADVVLNLLQPETVPAATAGIDHLDALVHCAGVADVATVADTPLAAWRDTLTVNLIAAAELTRALLPALRSAQGRVVFVNAAPGMSGVPGWSAYLASKAGLRELADALRDEEPTLRVTTIFPGATATELLAKVRAQSGRPYDPTACLRPEAVAELIATALTSEAHLEELSITP